MLCCSHVDEVTRGIEKENENEKKQIPYMVKILLVRIYRSEGLKFYVHRISLVQAIQEKVPLQSK